MKESTTNDGGLRMTETHIKQADEMPSLEFVANLTHEAGRLTLEYFRKSFGVSVKDDNLGLVTDADYASESLLKDRILSKFPAHVLLGEETGWSRASADEQVVWIVDPIDGTSNFSKGNSFYCVSVACGILKNEHFEPFRAAIYQPATDDLYTAAHGLGAWCNGTRLAVSTNSTDVSRWSVATGFSSNKGPSLSGVIRCIEVMQNKILGMRINGAAALDLALTSRGIFDGFFESRLSPWDMAAGDLLVREAGGVVVNYDGHPFNAISDKHIIAGPQHVVEYLLSMLHQVRDELMSNAWP